MNQAKNPKVSIVIVNYNGVRFLPELFDSLEKQSFKDFEIIVVDNASTDDSCNWLKKRKDIKFVRSKENLGFAGGNNLGVKLAVGKYIVLLNNDTIVDKKWLEELVKAIEKDGKRGAVVSKIYLTKPGLDKKVFDSAGSLYNNIGSCWSRGYLEEDKGQYDQEEEVPMGTACSLLFRKEILEKTYLFDDSFFMYVEEFDFNLRIRQLGYSIYYVPSSIVYHKTSQAVRGKTGNKRKEILFKQKYGNANRLNVLIKHYPACQLFKNFHLITLSFLYWDYYFLRYGGPGAFLELKHRQFNMFRKGLAERKEWIFRNKEWLKFMTVHSFRGLLDLKHEIAKRRLQYGE